MYHISNLKNSGGSYKNLTIDIDGEYGGDCQLH